MLAKLFAFVWRYGLIYHDGKPLKVIKVTGWRSALVDTPGGQRMRITLCLFPWEYKS